MISSLLVILLWLIGGALLITAALSPLETLSWWAGWSEEEIDDKDDTIGEPPAENIAERAYVVYLSGIGSLSGRFLIRREKIFLQRLREAMPDAVVVDDVFPYSPAGIPLLASPRLFDRLWRLVQKINLQGKRTILSVLIKARNIFQVLISADHRYGPIFNHGAANVIEAALLRAGYVRGSAAPITIIGYSGGGQVAVGAATFLTSRLKAPIDVISIGGVMASGPGLLALRRLHHVFGDGDNVQKIGAVVFPERWRFMPHSEWNTAKQEGKIFRHEIENMAHAGAKGYFGLPKRKGVSNNERTLEVVTGILTDDPAPPLLSG